MTDSTRMEFRFRIDPDPGGDPLRPRWRARYAHRHGFTEFLIRVDYERRVVGLGPLRFEFRLVGTEMSRMLAGESDKQVEPDGAGPYRKRPSGTWTVLRALLPAGDECFLLGLSGRSGHGEIVLHRPEYELALAGILACGIGREAFPWLAERGEPERPRLERAGPERLEVDPGPLEVDRFGGSKEVLGQGSGAPNGRSADRGAVPGRVTNGDRTGSNNETGPSAGRSSGRILPGHLAIGRAGSWLPNLDDDFELI